MGEHDWARQALQQALSGVQKLGMNNTVLVRALLAQALELNRELRDSADLAQELQFLAQNLDPERDYAFIRP